MADDFTQLAPGVGQSDALKHASKEGRDAEAGVTKALLTTAAGSIALSAGFLLGEKRTAFPLALLTELKWAWGLLFLSMVVGLVNWAITSTLMNVHATQLQEVLEHKRPSVSYFHAWVRAAYGMFWGMVLSCLLGLGMLCDLAIKLAELAATK